jgi:hypothetical protein
MVSLLTQAYLLAKFTLLILTILKDGAAQFIAIYKIVKQLPKITPKLMGLP